MFTIIRNLLKKQSLINRVLVAINPGQPVWTRVLFKQIADEGYLKNVYAYRCINLIAMACGGIPWLLYRKRGKLRELEEHPLLTLLNQPNPFQGQAKFIENVIAFLMLEGNSYIERVGPQSGVPRELYTLRPDRMMVVKGDRINPIGGYEYRANGMIQKFTPELILHLKTFHPLNDWYGLSPIQVAARSIDQNNIAKAWNVALLQNSARPSGALVTEQNLGDEQHHRLKAELEDKYQGHYNAGRPLLLEGGLDWKQISLNPADLEWLEGQKLSAKEIAIAFGVPPELMGDAESKTFSNYSQSRQAFYMETILPLMDWLRGEFNNWLVPLFGDNLYLDYDRDEIEAIQEDRQIIWARTLDAVKVGVLTINEAREAIGYEALSDEDVLGVEKVVVEEQVEEEEPPDDEEDADTDEDKDEDKDRKKPSTKLKSLGWKAFHLQTEDQKVTYWKAFDRLRSSWERTVNAKVTQQFQKEARRVVQAAKRSPDQVLTVLNTDEWKRLYTAFYTGIMEDFGERTLQSFKTDVTMQTKQDGELLPTTFDIWLAEAQAFVAATVTQRVSEVTDTTRKHIIEIISGALQEGDSIDTIAEKLEQLYVGFTPSRAESIARTETISASNAGSRYSAKSTELPLNKTWLATRDNRTRPSHRLLDGQMRSLDERYSNGLMFPGDPSGSPAETIQCRCVEYYSVIHGGTENGI